MVKINRQRRVMLDECWQRGWLLVMSFERKVLAHCIFCARHGERVRPITFKSRRNPALFLWRWTLLTFILAEDNTCQNHLQKLALNTCSTGS
jgi:hypothetical protein